MSAPPQTPPVVRAGAPERQPLGARLKEELVVLLKAYAGVYFCQKPVVGLLLLVATFVTPSHGLLGLLSALTTGGLARVLGLDPEGRGGFYALNGLLVGLALGLFYKLSLPLLGMLLVASLVTVAISAAARSFAELYLSVPVMSLPFVLSSWVMLLAARRFTGLEYTLEPILATKLLSGWVPEPVALYLQSLGAALFQINVPAGLLIFFALLAVSRWTVLLSILGYVAGTLTYFALGGLPADLTRELVGFNFILSAIAVGGIYVTLSPSSLGLAALGAVLSAGLSAALLSFLQSFNLPPLAFPFIAATHAILYTLGRRTRAGTLRLVEGIPGSPEQNLLKALGRQGRYPDPSTPLLALPVMGEWWVSQGHDGEHTHKGPWRHAWDLEVRDAQGRLYSGEGSSPTDYHCFGLPVLAPGDGQVVHAVGHLPDSAVGDADVVHNWGNCLVIWHGGTVYSLLAHLQRGSLSVAQGERVVLGQAIARAGSSGRAPRPHLHVQVQRSAVPGAPTAAAELLHYVEPREDGDPLYRTHGIPREGTVLRPMALSAARRTRLAFPLGASWVFEGSLRGRPVRERWTSVIDLLGARRVESDHGTSVALYVDPSYTTVTTYAGRGSDLLALLALALPRAPHTEEQVVWRDRLLPGRFLSGPGRLLYELALPFGELARLRTHSRYGLEGDELVVETEVEVRGVLAPPAGALPDRCRVHFAANGGPSRIVAYCKEELWCEATVVGS